MNEQQQTAVILAVLLPAYLILVLGWPKLRHWLVHRFDWPCGELVTWRRQPDNVLMVGNRCPWCGNICCIRPDKSSYRRMLLGRKWF